MALKKNFSEGTKFYYARVERVGFSKYGNIVIEVSIYVKDSEDEEYNILENNLLYTPNSGVSPWTIDNISLEGENVISAAYDWLKNNIELFNGWSDV